MMIALLIAGQHTSNVTGTWTGLHLLQDPERLRKAREELQTELGPGDQPATFASLKGLLPCILFSCLTCVVSHSSLLLLCSECLFMSTGLSPLTSHLYPFRLVQTAIPLMRQ